MEIQKLSTLMLECVQTDDIVGARRLLEGVNEEDMKSIVAKRDNCNGPLFVAAMRGNVDMVEFLSKECHADKEELGEYNYTYSFVRETVRLVTPLFCAAVSNNLEIVELLINLGADINAAPDTGGTPVLYACEEKNVDAVKCLIKHGADVEKPDNYGRTCLMILFDRAIDSNYNNCDNRDIEDILLLMIDHGADPYLKNNYLDYDAFQMASHYGLESILQKLLLRIQPPAKCWIESYELLGIHYASFDNEKAFSYWKEAVEMRGINSGDNVNCLPPNAVYLFAKEVNTVEELETLFQNQDCVYMHALMLRERILGPNHSSIQREWIYCSRRYTRAREFRRGFEILRYAYQQQNARVEQMTHRVIRVRYTRPLYELCLFFDMVYRECHLPNSMDSFRIHFQDVFEILQMAISKIDEATGIIYSMEFQNDSDLPHFFMKSLLYLLKLMTEIDKDENEKLRFNKVIYRLVRCQPITGKGQTLLHLSVEQSMIEFDEDFYYQLSSIAVVELLLDCGANVNAVDDEHNTALHSCSKAIRDHEMAQHHDLIKQIAVLLLTHGAHPDMVNHSGDNAVIGLTSSLIEMNILDFRSLKCLAASAVGKYRTPYVGHIPAELNSFVQMHELLGALNDGLPQ